MTQTMRALTLVTAFSVLFPASAGFGQQQLPCEFLARVNDEIIARADYEEALRDFRGDLNELVRTGRKTHAEIEAELESAKPTVLDSMIEDLLLDQMARILRLAADPGLNKVIESNSRPRLGLIPISAREQKSFRGAMLREKVIQREVVAPLVRNTTERERIDYYNHHPEDFTLPGTVTLSQVFIPFAGHTDIVSRAKEVLAGLRSGGSFVEAVRQNTPSTDPLYSRDGYAGTFKTGDLRLSIADAVKKLEPGEFADLILESNGYRILRLDQRTPPMLLPFIDPAVQKRVTVLYAASRLKAARALYILGLRERARIEICQKL